MPPPEDPYSDVFETKPPEEAVGPEKKTFYRIDADAEREKKRQRNLKKKTSKKIRKVEKSKSLQKCSKDDELWDKMDAE